MDAAVFFCRMVLRWRIFKGNHAKLNTLPYVQPGDRDLGNFCNKNNHGGKKVREEENDQARERKRDKERDNQ